MAKKESRFSRRTTALLWSLAVAVVIFVLIGFEQIPILYVIATIGLVSLLVIVGFSDLENVGRENAENFAMKEE